MYNLLFRIIFIVFMVLISVWAMTYKSKNYIYKECLIKSKYLPDL